MVILHLFFWISSKNTLKINFQAILINTETNLRHVWTTGKSIYCILSPINSEVVKISTQERLIIVQASSQY